MAPMKSYASLILSFLSLTDGLGNREQADIGVIGLAVMVLLLFLDTDKLKWMCRARI